MVALAVAAVLAAAAPACRTIAVADSIQAAVDQAQPCDWVLVPPGLYPENVVVATPTVHVRGMNRNTVVVEGGIDVQADGVSVENLTVRGGPVRWGAVHGWKGSYLTVYATDPSAPRGLSAEAGADGAWDHVYAGGYAEAGIICDACRATLAHALAERNAVGVSATGRVGVRDSLFRLNGFGVRFTVTGSTIRTSRVEQNDRIGIELDGTTAAVVANNVVLANRTFGIVGHEGTADPFPQLVGNRIVRNVVRGSRYDLALEGGLYGTMSSPGNCVAGNLVRTTLPADLSPWRCGSGSTPNPDPAASGTIFPLVQRLLAAPRPVKLQPAPPPQPTLPNPCTGVPATGLCTRH
jgi:Right handed beta helix region